jgi:hypothetical protein
MNLQVIHIGVAGSTGGGDWPFSVSDVLHQLQQLLFPPLLLVSTPKKKPTGKHL